MKADKVPTEKIKRKTKVWIGLLLILALIAGAVFLTLYAEKCLILENLRLTLREVRLECTAGYWRGKSISEQEQKAAEFAKRLGLVPGETNLFSFGLRELREKALLELPEIDVLTAYRVIPDQLVFRIVERNPVARIGGGLFLDQSGRVMDQRYCADLGQSLPVVSEISGLPRRTLKRGDRITSENVLLALDFIAMAALEYPAIRITKVISMKIRDNDYLQCELFYKNAPGAFVVRLPTRITREKLHTEIPERLIPALEEGIRDRTRPEGQIRSLTLTFENQVVVNPR